VELRTRATLNVQPYPALHAEQRDLWSRTPRQQTCVIPLVRRHGEQGWIPPAFQAAFVGEKLLRRAPMVTRQWRTCVIIAYIHHLPAGGEAAMWSCERERR
jgi:hypothetical protein